MEHVSSARPTGKFPEKVENLKRWARFPGWNFRTECRVPFTFLVVCTSSRSTVGHCNVPGFTTKWNNFSPIGNSTFAPTEISGFFSLMESAPWVCLWCKRQFPVATSVVHTYRFPRVRLLPLATVKPTVPPNNQYGELDNIISLEEFRNLLSLGPISTLNDDLNFFCSILVSVYAVV